jgi:hypothetical protein
VDDAIVPVSGTGTPYYVVIEWWDDYRGFWDETTYQAVNVLTNGYFQILRY